MFNVALNNRLSYLNTCHAAIDRDVDVVRNILDTYEGMLSLHNNGEGADSVLVNIDKWETELASLAADRAEIDGLWNEALLAAEIE